MMGADGAKRIGGRVKGRWKRRGWIGEVVVLGGWQGEVDEGGKDRWRKADGF